MAGKYDPLKRHLMSLDQNVWQTFFTEIEKIIADRLPFSARNRPQWWGNERNENRVHAFSWVDAGWHTENLNLTGEKVTFRKTGKG